MTKKYYRTIITIYTLYPTSDGVEIDELARRAMDEDAICEGAPCEEVPAEQVPEGVVSFFHGVGGDL